jgi:hypothetical protein
MHERHHFTGRDAGGAYFDPRLWVPLCHDDHSVQDDDWRTLGIDLAPACVTRLERRELTLRRAATLCARRSEVAGPSVDGALAIFCVDTADDLRLAISGLDRAVPGWRSFPEVRDD